VIRIVTKIEFLGPWAMSYPSKKFPQNPFTTFSVIRRIDIQTDKQTEVKTTIGVGAQSTLGGTKFLPEEYVLKIRKMPEFY